MISGEPIAEPVKWTLSAVFQRSGLIWHDAGVRQSGEGCAGTQKAEDVLMMRAKGGVGKVATSGAPTITNVPPGVMVLKNAPSSIFGSSKRQRLGSIIPRKLLALAI